MRLSGQFLTSDTEPATTTRPPASPPSGPMSMIQSALRITSKSCSITTTVAPVFNQAVDDAEKCLDIKWVQADRGFVKNKDSVALSARHFAR